MNISIKSGRRWGRRLLALLTAGVLLTAAAPAPSAALAGYSNGRLTIISEPDQMSDLVSYYKDGEEADRSGMTWVDGRNGKALLLDGKSEYLQLGYAQLKTNRFSFAGWINWKGAAAGKAEDTKYAQRLFTYARRQDHWLTVAPHAKNTAQKTADGSGFLNGIYLSFHFGGRNGMDLEQFNAGSEQVAYGIPTDEWHHIAVVSDQQTMKLYVDGVLWFQDILLMSMVELSALSMKIGAGFEDDSYLHAALDDVGIYEIALTAEQVATLAAGGDPLVSGTTTPTTTAPYLPTRPTATEPTVAGDRDASRAPATILGLPVVSVVIMGAIVLLVVTLSIVLSVQQGPSSASKAAARPKQRKGGGSHE